MIPDGYWWAKSDGCDVVPGLTESMRLDWGGDVDLGDGELQKQHEDYLCWIQLVKSIICDLHNLQQRSTVVSNL